MKKKLVLLIPILLGVLAIGAGVLMYLRSHTGTAAEEGNLANVEWYSLDEEEFTINTVEEFYEFAKLSEFYDFKKQTVKLGADLVLNEGDANDWEKEAPEMKWYGVEGFAGTFDGQGHSISGVYSLKHMGTVGLFVDSQPNCKIQDFRLLNSYFETDGGTAVGSIVGSGAGHFRDIYSDAIVISNTKGAGGLIGELSSGGASSVMAYVHSMSNCWFDGEVRLTDKADGFRAGGLVGIATNGTLTIEHCLNSGDVSGYINHLGGIVGFIMNDSGSSVHIKDSFNSGKIRTDYPGGATAAIVGRVGFRVSAVLENTAATTESHEVGIYGDGSVKGYVIQRSEEELTGYGGYQWTNLDFDNYWAVCMDSTPILKYFADDIPDLTGVVKEFDVDWYDSTKSEFVITNRAQLYGFALLFNETDFEGKTVKFGADIVVNEGKASKWAKIAPKYEWVPVGTFSKPFKGILDGQGHSISGLYVKDEKQGTGFIRCMNEDSAIKNLKILNSYIESAYEKENDTAAIVGGIVGRGSGLFENIYSDAIVISKGGYLGGFVGQSAGKMKITNCWFDGSVTSTGEKSQYIGGMIGMLQNPVERILEHCLFSGEITAKSNHIGGFVGYVVNEGCSVVLRDSLSVGTINTPEPNAVAATLGRVVKGPSVTVRTTTAATETTPIGLYKEANASVSGFVAQIDQDKLIGNGGYEWTELDFKNYWSVVKEGTPVLKTFAKKTQSTKNLTKMIDTSWYDAAKDVYVIDSLAKLNGFNAIAQTNDFAGKTVQIATDITFNSGDAKDWDSKAPANNWKPIGSLSMPFKGTVDGQGHTINGLYIKDDAAGVGLFRCMAQESVVKNLKIVNSYIESTVEKDNAAIMGVVAGRGSGTFEKIYTDAIMVSYGGYVGGIVGQSTGKMDVSNCWFEGSITATGPKSNWIGGLIGVVQNEAERTISHCLNTGTITGPVNQIGGLCGVVINEGAVLTVTDSMNAGAIVSGDSNAIGSIVGRVVGSSVVNVSTTIATTESCKTTVYKDGTATVNGAVIQKPEADLTGNGGYVWSELDFGNYWSIAAGDTPVLTCFASSSPSVSGKRMIDTTWYDAADDTYEINSIAQLNGLSVFGQMHTFENKTILLTDNVTLNEGTANEWATNAPTYKWTPIGTFVQPFNGTFDGQGYTISGLYTKDTQGVGLFASVGAKGVVRDLRLINSYMEGDLIVGGIAGRGAGTYEKLYVDAMVTANGDGYVGGIIGQGVDALKITNCQNAGEVTATGNAYRVGGFIGVAQGTKAEIHSSLNSGAIYCAFKSHIGGFVGHLAVGELVMDNCFNSGDINAKSGAAGSIVGRVQRTLKVTVTNTFATTESCNNTIYADPTAIVNEKEVAGGSVSDVVEAYTKGGLIGYGSAILTTLDFDTYWSAVKGSVAELQAFTTREKLTATEDMKLDTGWYEGDYTINTIGELFGFVKLSQTNTFVDKTIKLGADFEFNTGDPESWTEEELTFGWQPISKFSGTLLGEGHTIKGLYIKSDKQGIGFFAETTTASKVSNLKLENSYMESVYDDGAATFMNAVVGGVAAIGNGTFDKISTDIVMKSVGGRIGGIVGQVTKGAKFSECWNKSDINASNTRYSPVGGIVGYVENSAEKVTFEHCLNTGNITSSYTYVGGLCGWSQGVTTIFTDSLNVGKITPVSSGTVGSIMGRAQNGTTTEVQDVFGLKSTCTQAIYADANAILKGGAVQVENLTGIDGYKNTSLDFTNYWIAIAGKTPELRYFSTETAIPTTGVGKSIIPDTSWYTGNKTEYTIQTVQALYGFQQVSRNTNFAGVTIKLGADIVINPGTASATGFVRDDGTAANTWTPVGTGFGASAFSGTFDGQGHTITGLVAKGQHGVGMFGYTIGATIKDLTLDECYVEGTGLGHAGIVGRGNGIFQNLKVDVHVKSTSGYAGGIVGQGIANDINGGGTGTIKIEKCCVSGSITGSERIGGFVGSSNSLVTVLQSKNLANFSASTYYIGGIVGEVNAGATITATLNAGAIETSGKSHEGGFIGYVAGGNVSLENCLNMGKVNGKNGASAAFIGRMLGGKSLTVSNCYATAESSNVQIWADNGAIVNGVTFSGGNNSSGITVLAETKLTGEAAKTNAPNLNWEDYWMTTDTFPTLRGFEEKVEKEPLRVLMIGNSFCYYFPDELYGMGQAAGIDMVIYNVYSSGCPLQKHWEWYQQSASNYEIRKNGKTYMTNASLEDVLDNEDWDVITFQTSSKSIYASVDEFVANELGENGIYLTNMYNMLKEKFPNAKFMWHRTWEYEYYSADTTGKYPTSRQEQLQYYANHEAFIEQYMRVNFPQLDIVPTGNAWELARQSGIYGLTGSTSNKIDQSGPADNQLGDYYHDGDIGGGQYLNACVWFEALTGESCIGNTFTPSYTLNTYTLSDSTTVTWSTLQNFAHSAVETAKQKNYLTTE